MDAVHAVTGAERERRYVGWRRAVLWVFTASTFVVAVGVLWQAFTIVSYIRGAGQEARDLHVAGAYVVHMTEFVVFGTALVAFWRDWWRIGLAALLPLYGTVQVFAIGATSRPGGWATGAHGVLALIVLLQASAMTFDGACLLRGSRPGADAGRA